jgi:hypothetical protein
MQEFPVRWLVVSLWLLLSPGVSGAEEWQLVRRDEARDIRAYLRDVPGTAYKGFYATTRVKASLSSIVAVLSDVPAMPEWVARMRAARMLKRDANREVWVHGVYQLPYPFVEREAVLHATLSQKKSGVVEVVTHAVGGMVGRHPKRVRLTNMHSIWRLTPERGGVVKIELWGQGDPGGYVPPLIFNYNLPDEPMQTLRNLRQMLIREKYLRKTLPYIREP